MLDLRSTIATSSAQHEGQYLLTKCEASKRRECLHLAMLTSSWLQAYSSLTGLSCFMKVKWKIQFILCFLKCASKSLRSQSLSFPLFSPSYPLFVYIPEKLCPSQPLFVYKTETLSPSISLFVYITKTFFPSIPLFVYIPENLFPFLLF